jgi:SAM-dependent methyltransferase
MQSDEQKRIVRDGYDAVSEAYRGDGKDPPAEYALWVTRALAGMAGVPSVLELGCGCGVPVAAMLATRCRYVGVDLSPLQIARARRLAPGGEFVCADMSELRFEARSFDAVIALYSIIHLPLDEQLPLLKRIETWLRPGSVFLATVGHANWTGCEKDWLGVAGATMYWSHADAQTYRGWCGEAGLEILVDEFIAEGTGGHQLIQARKRSDGIK